MALNIVVCVKNTPSTSVSVDPATGKVKREGVALAISPYDEYAVEEAVRLKRWDEAAREGDKLLLDVLHRPHSALQTSLFYLYAGEAYQGHGDHRRATEYFTWGIAASPDGRKATVTYLLLRQGQSLDLLDRRDAALERYRQVAKRKDYFDSIEKARAGIKKPVTQEELFKQLEE